MNAVEEKLMQSPIVDRLAADLLQARRSGELLSPKMHGANRLDYADAYAVQDLVTQHLGPTGGWKVGARGPNVLPNCAPLPAHAIYASPRALTVCAKGRCAVEAEIALRLKKDLPLRATPYGRADVIDAVGSIHAAIEVVGSRYAESPDNDMLGLADSLSNSALIVGPARMHELEIDQQTQAAELYFNAERVAVAYGGNPVGDIWELVVWLANHAAARCGGLLEGQVITTGSCTGLAYAKPGTRVKAVFPGLGVAELLVE
jgi:2-keto-4-pentenoate hydratase